jgi:nucleotide-binding universal stress UspA family protein
MHQRMTGCRRILVAYDGGPAARQALEDALAVAQQRRATLTILCVVPPVSPLVLLGGVGPAMLVEAGVRREACAAISELGRWFPVDVPFTTVIRFGRPVAEIRAALAGGSFDAVFVGGSRTRRWRRPLAARVAARSSVHVHVAHRQARPVRLSWGVRSARSAHRA